MAYEEFLIKIGKYIIPADRFIKFNSYKVHLSVIDLDSYRDANAFLHRNVLPHVPVKVEFETPAMLTCSQFEDLMKNIRENYTVPAERKAQATVYVPELNTYVTQDVYMSDPKPSIYCLTEEGPIYNSINITFTGY